MLCTAAAICLLQDQKEEPEFSEDEVETLLTLFRTKLDAIPSSQSADLLLLGKPSGHLSSLLVEAVSLILSIPQIVRHDTFACLGEDPESSANGAPPVPPARLYAAMYRYASAESLAELHRTDFFDR